MVNVWEETLEALGSSANLFREDFGPTSESLAHDISREMAMYPDIPELDLDADLQGGAVVWGEGGPGRSPNGGRRGGKSHSLQEREAARGGKGATSFPFLPLAPPGTAGGSCVTPPVPSPGPPR